MAIHINKFFRAPILKLVPEYGNPELVREVELARAKALTDAYMSGGVIGS